jgi:hypothetical protein
MKTYKEYITETEEYMSLLESAAEYLTEEEIRVLRENPKILQEWGWVPAITAATLIAKYGKKAYYAAKRLFNKKLGTIVDRNFDKNQKMIDFDKTGPGAKKDLVVTPKPPKQEILPPEVKPKLSEPKPRTSYRVSQKAKRGEPEIIQPGEQSYGATKKEFVRLSQLRQERDLARATAKSRSPEALAKRAEMKAQQLAKYKETGDVENLRGLSPSDVYKAGGKEALRALSKKLD